MNPQQNPVPQQAQSEAPRAPIPFRKVRRRAKPVDFINHKDDHNVALYASLGFSTAFIVKQTGLSECQVTYRIRAAGLTRDNSASRIDFRNGTSPFSGLMLYAVQKAADAELIRHLKKYT